MYAWHDIDITSLPAHPAFDFMGHPTNLELDWVKVQIRCIPECSSSSFLLERNECNLLFTNHLLEPAELARVRAGEVPSTPWLHEVGSVAPLIADAESVVRLIQPGLFLTAGVDREGVEFLCIQIPGTGDGRQFVVRPSERTAVPWSPPQFRSHIANGLLPGMPRPEDREDWVWDAVIALEGQK